MLFQSVVGSALFVKDVKDENKNGVEVKDPTIVKRIAVSFIQKHFKKFDRKKCSKVDPKMR